jgi:DNA-binding transcriptional MerR regulator
MLLNVNDPLSEIMTMSQAAAEVGRSPATMRDWVRNGDLVPLRLPGSRRTYTTAREVREAESRIWARLTTRDG